MGGYEGGGGGAWNKGAVLRGEINKSGRGWWCGDEKKKRKEHTLIAHVVIYLLLYCIAWRHPPNFVNNATSASSVTPPTTPSS